MYTVKLMNKDNGVRILKYGCGYSAEKRAEREVNDPSTEWVRSEVYKGDKSRTKFRYSRVTGLRGQHYQAINVNDEKLKGGE
jgi:hypothetical protein